MDKIRMAGLLVWAILLDSLTTLHGVARPEIREANPVLRQAIVEWGLTSAIVLKTVVSVCGVAILVWAVGELEVYSEVLAEISGRVVFSGLLGFYLCVVLSNLWILS